MIEKNDRGITLIVLIITIIIMLILLGVTVDVAIDGNLFDNAQKTIDKANDQTANENEQAEHIKNVWDELPGEIIKGGTMLETGIELSVITSDVTRTSFKIHAKGTSETGETLTYTLKVGNTTYEEKTGAEVYWEITGLTENTTYLFEVIAKDSVSKTRATGQEKTLANTAPQIVQNYADNKTLTSFNANVSFSDEENESLTYSIMISTSENGEYTTKVSNASYTSTSGAVVTHTISGLNEASIYYWKVEVSDSVSTVTSEPIRTTTLCPGSGSTCTATLCTKNQTYCPTCGGVYKETCGTYVEQYNVTGSGLGIDDADGKITCVYSDCNASITISSTYGSLYKCNSCSAVNRWRTIKCPTCSGWFDIDQYGNTRTHDSADFGTHYNYCSTCSKANQLFYTSTCSTHSRSGKHYYCNTHGYVGTSSTHSCCSAHGVMGEHDWE